MSKWKEIQTYMEVNPYTGQEIDEDMPTNAAGRGAVAGIGVGPDGEPGINPKKKKKKTLIDARSKSYRQHRERLEKARIKRQESKKNRGDFVESIVSEMTYGVGSLPAMRPQADMANINSAKSATGYEIYHKKRGISLMRKRGTSLMRKGENLSREKREISARKEGNSHGSARKEGNRRPMCREGG